MGIVLPHGGVDAKQFHNPHMEWVNAQLPLEVDTPLFAQAEFVRDCHSAGYFAIGALVTPLVLFGREDGWVDWWVCVDGVQPEGLPKYYTTCRTANALMRAKQMADDVVQIDGTKYRLHAAFVQELHLAVLMRVEP